MTSPDTTPATPASAEAAAAETLTALGSASGPGGGPDRTARGMIPLLGIGSFGANVALFAPSLLGLALKARDIAGADGQASALSLLTGVGILFALVANPLAGRLSDRTTSRFGRRRPWILGGSIVSLGGFVLLGVTSDLWLALLGWCVAQVAMNAALAALNATVPDQVAEQQRGAASAAIGVGGPVAILAAVGLVAVLPRGVLQFVVPAVIAVVLLTLFVLVIKDRPADRATRTPFGAKEFFGSFVFNPGRYPNFGWVWLNRFLMFFGYAGVATYLTYYVIERFGVGDAEVGGVVFLANLFSTAGTVVSSILGGIISDRLHLRRPFVTIAGLIMVVGILGVAFAPSLGVLFAAQLVLGLGFGSYVAVDLALVTQVLPDAENRAKDLGVFNIANTLAGAAGPAIAPLVLAIGTATHIGGYRLYFIVGSVVAAVGAFVVYRVKGIR